MRNTKLLSALVTLALSNGYPAWASETKHWDYDFVKEHYHVYDSQHKFGDLVFQTFSYYEPGVERAEETRWVGFEILKSGKTTTIYLPDERCPNYEVAIGIDDDLPDFDGDGSPDLVIYANTKESSSLKVISQKTGELTYSYTGPGKFYKSMEVDEGNEKYVSRIMGSDASNENDVLVSFQNGKVAVQPWPFGPDILNFGRRAAVSWRTNDQYDWKYLIESCTSNLEQNPNDAPMLALRAALRTGHLLCPVHATKEQKELAIADAKSALNIDKNNALAHAVLGHLSDLAGQPDKAVEEFSASVAIQPRHPEWYANRALAYESMGQPAKAIEDYTKEISLDPKSSWAYASRAHANFDKNDMKAAVADATVALSLDSTNTFARKQRSRAYGNMHQEAKALPDFELIAKAEANDAENLVMLGYCCKTLGLREKALVAFKKALQINPKNAQAKAELTSMLKAKKVIPKYLSRPGH